MVKIRTRRFTFMLSYFPHGLRPKSWFPLDSSSDSSRNSNWLAFFTLFFIHCSFLSAALSSTGSAANPIDVLDCPLGMHPVFQETWACGQNDMGVFYETQLKPEEMDQYYRLLFQGTEWKEIKITSEAESWMQHWMASLTGGNEMPLMLPRLIFSNGVEFWSLTTENTEQPLRQNLGPLLRRKSKNVRKVFLHLKSAQNTSVGSAMLSDIPEPYPNSKLLLSHQVHNGQEETAFYSFQGGTTPEAVLDHLRNGFIDSGWQENPMFGAFRKNLEGVPKAQFRMEGKDWKADVYQKEGQLALVFADQEQGLPLVFYGIFLRKGSVSFPENSTGF